MDARLQANLERVRELVASALCDEIAPLFTPDMKLTLVARHPDNPECHLLVTNDADLPAVAAVIGWHAGKAGG